MDLNIETQVSNGGKKTFLSHVFSTAEEDKAEILNVVQYALYAIIPVVILNKLIQRFIPDADSDKSSLELLAEIVIQLIVIFCGLVLIHRIITYFPTYSGFKYENLTLTNVILAFLVIVLSIQSKLGLKVNIIVDRVNELWNGYPKEDVRDNKKVRVSQPLSKHSPSQADYLDSSSVQQGMFPPAPSINAPARHSNDMIHTEGFNSPASQDIYNPGPMAANSVLGGSFGSAF